MRWWVITEDTWKPAQSNKTPLAHVLIVGTSIDVIWGVRCSWGIRKSLIEAVRSILTRLNQRLSGPLDRIWIIFVREVTTGHNNAKPVITVITT
jgi:hypothetical protein